MRTHIELTTGKGTPILVPIAGMAFTPNPLGGCRVECVSGGDCDPWVVTVKESHEDVRDVLLRLDLLVVV